MDRGGLDGPAVEHPDGGAVARLAVGPEAFSLRVRPVLVEHAAVGLDVDHALGRESAVVAGGDLVAASGVVGIAPRELAPLARVGLVGRGEQEPFRICAWRVPKRGNLRDEEKVVRTDAGLLAVRLVERLE